MNTRQQLALLEGIQSLVARRLQSDDRVRAVWLGGSLSGGAGDALSDIDLVVVASEGRLQDLVQDRGDLIAIPGQAVLVHEAPQNAPDGGAQLNVLYDTVPLPLYVDWNLWPPVDERPADLTVLLERGEQMLASADTLESMLARMPRPELPPKTEKEWNRFRAYMVPVLMKSAARGWFDSVAEILGYMRVGHGRVTTIYEALAVADGVLEDCGDLVGPEAVRCIRRYMSQVQSWTPNDR